MVCTLEGSYTWPEAHPMAWLRQRTKHKDNQYDYEMSFFTHKKEEGNTYYIEASLIGIHS